MKNKSKSKIPVAVPQQTRSTRTQQNILAAVERHLLAGTFDQASVQDIVAEAGCSVGAFYGRFANKAAAVYHFYDARCLDLEVLANELLNSERPEPLAVLLSDFTQTIVRRTFDYAAIIRSDALRITSDPDNPFTLRARALNARLLKSLHTCLSTRKSEVLHPASPETALFVLAMIGGLSRDAVLNSTRLIDDPCDFTVDRFARELTLAVFRYLGVRQ